MPATSSAPPDHRFTIVFPDTFLTCTMTTSHDRWRDSLVRNMGYHGESHVFMLTDLVVLDHGVERTQVVYQNTGHPDEFMVRPAEHFPIIIDRGKSVIGTMGCGGVSTHPHPDGKMIVCLEPGNDRLGVLLSDAAKWEVPPPSFSGNRVSWTWGRE